METKKSLKSIWYIITAFIAAVVSVLALTFGASAETSGDYEYRVLGDGTIEITDYTGTATELVIPSEIDGYKVISIGYMAFRECKLLSSVTIPDSVEDIDFYAFENCISLTDITLGSGVNAIDNKAFSGCKRLVNITLSENNVAFKIENDVLYTKDGTSIVIYPKNKADESFIIPNSVTSIGSYTFSGCENLTRATIPNSVTSIGDYAFSDCKSLTSITIPNSVTSIDQGAFSGCKSLRSVAIPDSVTSMGTYTFLYCSNLEKIYISKGLKTLPKCAFYGCSNLISVKIPDGVKSIGEEAFGSCGKLTSIIIPKSVLLVDNGAFLDCSSLTDVYYSSSKEDWNKIIIDDRNSKFTDATIYYNYVDPTELVSAFVDRLYVILLNRNAEAEGLDDWTNRLTSGTATSAEIVYGIAASQEFGNRGLSNEEIVETMYQAMLGRASDEGGKANWINCLNSGMTVTGIINGFSGSQEFANICAEYGIQAGAITTCDSRDRNNGLTLFVSRMYTKALGRAFDVAGLNDWTNRYLTGEAKVSDIAFGFIFSPEFVGKNLSNSDYVDTLYRTFFNREPDEGGKADWMNKLADGMAREDVLNGFVGSQECINLVATFGI